MLPIWESLLFEPRSSPDNPMAQQPPLLFILIDLFGFQLNCILNSTVRESLQSSTNVIFPKLMSNHDLNTAQIISNIIIGKHEYVFVITEDS